MTENHARLVSEDRGIGTFVLPWWPSEVTHSYRNLAWEQTQRPGRQDLLTARGMTLDTYQLSFTLRARDLATHVAADLNTLERMNVSTKPVVLFLGRSARGWFQVTDLSVVEVDHDTVGRPVIADVSLTLTQESTVRVKVGPVRRSRGNG